jgi:hypothetical protein
MKFRDIRFRPWLDGLTAEQIEAMTPTEYKAIRKRYAYHHGTFRADYNNPHYVEWLENNRERINEERLARRRAQYRRDIGKPRPMTVAKAKKKHNPACAALILARRKRTHERLLYAASLLGWSINVEKLQNLPAEKFIKAVNGGV